MKLAPGYKGLVAFCEAIDEPLLPHEQRIAKAFFGPAREIVAILPRGNLKTTLAAKIGLHRLLTVDNAAVTVGAASRDQARIAFERMKGFTLNPELDGLLKVRHLELRYDEDRRLLRVVPSEGARVHGLSSSLYIRRGNVRHVAEISQLLDVTVTAAPAYAAAAAELRTRSDSATDGAQTTSATEGAAMTTETTTPAAGAAEDRTDAPITTGGLRVEERVSVTNEPRRGLADEFRSRGWPGEIATMPWDEYESRAVTWTPSMDLLNQPQRQAGAFPYDQRYAWPALPRVAVDAAATSVLVLSQTARALAPPRTL